jgi:hypothetical protein
MQEIVAFRLCGCSTRAGKNVVTVRLGKNAGKRAKLRGTKLGGMPTTTTAGVCLLFANYNIHYVSNSLSNSPIIGLNDMKTRQSNDANVSFLRGKLVPTLSQQTVRSDFVIEAVSHLIIDRVSLSGRHPQLRYINVSLPRVKFLEH